MSQGDKCITCDSKAPWNHLTKSFQTASSDSVGHASLAWQGLAHETLKGPVGHVALQHESFLMYFYTQLVSYHHTSHIEHTWTWRIEIDFGQDLVWALAKPRGKLRQINLNHLSVELFCICAFAASCETNHIPFGPAPSNDMLGSLWLKLRSQIWDHGFQWIPMAGIRFIRLRNSSKVKFQGSQLHFPRKKHFSDLSFNCLAPMSHQESTGHDVGHSSLSAEV